MKSIKPGRGPSIINAIMAIFVAIFGVFWTFMALGSGAPNAFALFGIVFSVFAAIKAVYNIKNATSKNRYSVFDITDSNEEIDPFQEKIHNDELKGEDFLYTKNEIGFCPYCGSEADFRFKYCMKCGKELPL